MSINVGKFFFSLLSSPHYSRFDDVRHTIKSSFDVSRSQISLDFQEFQSFGNFQISRVKVTQGRNTVEDFQLIERSLRRLDFITHSAAIEIYRNEFDVVQRNCYYMRNEYEHGERNEMGGCEEDGWNYSKILMEKETINEVDQFCNRYELMKIYDRNIKKEENVLSFIV